MIRRGLLALLSAGGLILGVLVVFHLAGVRVNASASLPIGLYRISGDPSARLVEFCPTEPFGTLSAERGYRANGNCPDGAEPLMKPIVAVPGDVVTFSEAGIAVNGRLLRNSAPRQVDTKNRPLQHWPFGTYAIAPGTVWVISSYNARSFDSRYFGPITLASVRHHLRPLATE
jgi:conjugative transfer signal peptidase TraF